MPCESEFILNYKDRQDLDFELCVIDISYISYLDNTMCLS